MNRAYRYLVAPSSRMVATSVAILGLMELALVWHRSWFIGQYRFLVTYLVQASQLPVSFELFYLQGTSAVIPVAQLEVQSVGRLWLWLGVSMGGIALLTLRKLFELPLRYFVNANFLLIGISVLWEWLVLPLKDQSAAFSLFYLQTAVLLWLTAPLLLGILSCCFPAAWWWRGILLAGVLGYAFLFSAVKYVMCLWVLTWMGTPFILNLYCFLGPLLDIVLVSGFFAVFLSLVSSTMNQSPNQEKIWQW
ncbi:MAG: hypothetical protein HY774_23105 [Acidobacteria bacterium]|nr:hypothetical protein [Acidobacteriota bacterium]